MLDKMWLSGWLSPKAKSHWLPQSLLPGPDALPRPGTSTCSALCWWGFSQPAPSSFCKASTKESLGWYFSHGQCPVQLSQSLVPLPRYFSDCSHFWAPPTVDLGKLLKCSIVSLSLNWGDDSSQPLWSLYRFNEVIKHLGQLVWHISTH